MREQLFLLVFMLASLALVLGRQGLALRLVVGAFASMMLGTLATEWLPGAASRAWAQTPWWMLALAFPFVVVLALASLFLVVILLPLIVFGPLLRVFLGSAAAQHTKGILAADLIRWIVRRLLGRR